ncbi:FRG domain-containing protein [Burkholderia aenigmatica]|nr:FRG domain-containing protein [Burkholderia aenigmatica]UKD13228.1 FRG domain-containing protein [Burkholderia aenigmatica]
MNGDTSYLFRGHRDETWPLKPSIARHRWASDTIETDMLDEFKRRSIPYLESTYELKDADWLAIAQHHGMPTRLLDWSGSALTALWFAVNQPAGDSEAGAVWLLSYSPKNLMSNEERDQPFKIDRTVLFRPRHVSRRIAAQDGWFTIHRSHQKGARYISLDTNTEFEESLRFVIIPKDAFGRMRLQLMNAGVTSATLYPDLDGVARYVSRTTLYDDDELDARVQSLL